MGRSTDNRHTPQPSPPRDAQTPARASRGESSNPAIRNPTSDRIEQRFIVHGHVQGVGFRAATRSVAQRLGVDANPVNLADGTVEVTAAGPPDGVQALHRWLRHGPPHARVTAVDSMARA